MRNVKYALQRGVTDKLGNMHEEMINIPYNSREAIVQSTLDGIVFSRIIRIHNTTLNSMAWRT